MDSAPFVLLACVSILFIGVAIGYMMGISRGVSIGMKMAKPPPSPLGWIMFMMGSGLALLVALGTTIYSIYFLANSVPSVAKVVEVIRSQDKEGYVHDEMIYSYTVHDGDSVREYTNRGQVTPGGYLKMGPGDMVPIRYLKSSPQRSRVDEFFNHWILPIVTACMSAVMAAISLTMRWWYRRSSLAMVPIGKPVP